MQCNSNYFKGLFLCCLSVADNSFQAEEPAYNQRFKAFRKSSQYSSSVPITMPTGKNSPPEDNDVCYYTFFCSNGQLKVTADSLRV